MLSCKTGSVGGDAPQETDVNKANYDLPGVFIYSVTERLPANTTTRTDTLGLFTSGIPFKDVQQLMQWQYLNHDSSTSHRYKIDEARIKHIYTGIGINDSLLFIHPPRSGKFKILQFCPYPYVENGKGVGDSWDFILEVDSYWRIDSIIPIEGVDTFTHRYTIQKDTVIDFADSQLHCLVIDATNSSVYGTSTARYIFNNDRGLVSYHIRTHNGQEFDFVQIDRLAGIDSIAFNVSTRPTTYSLPLDRWLDLPPNDQLYVQTRPDVLTGAAARTKQLDHCRLLCRTPNEVSNLPLLAQEV